MRSSNSRSLRGKCAQGASRLWQGRGGMCYQLPHILPVTRDIKVWRGGVGGAASSPADRLILAPQVLSRCCQSVIFFCSSSVICLPRNSIRLFLFVWRYWIVNCLSHPSNVFRFTKSALSRYLTADSLPMIEYFYFGFISAETLTCYTFDSFSLLISSHLDRFSFSSSFLKRYLLFISSYFTLIF